MEAMPSESRGAPAGDRSTSELLTQLTEQVSRLVRDEMRLARLEMTRKGRQAGLGAGLMGGGSVLALYGLGCLLACAIIAISIVLPSWLAALVVGAALLLAAGVAALAGRSRLRRAAPPVPAQAADSVRADVEEIREKAHR